MTNQELLQLLRELQMLSGADSVELCADQVNTLRGIAIGLQFVWLDDKRRQTKRHVLTFCISPVELTSGPANILQLRAIGAKQSAIKAGALPHAGPLFDVAETSGTGSSPQPRNPLA